ncbi:MAG: hypothetical protein DI538_15685 [Azospira oryzae]|nr:MAG: hypothetical protein DI538_15685 [Azospira oryzae]
MKFQVLSERTLVFFIHQIRRSLLAKYGKFCNLYVQLALSHDDTTACQLGQKTQNFPPDFIYCDMVDQYRFIVVRNHGFVY